MKKLNQLTIAYLKWVSPVAILTALLSAMGKSNNTLFFDILGVITIIWILFLVYIVFALTLQDSLRNRFVRWIAGIKENDERETYIAGQTSKKTFIFMTAFIVLLIFLSIIRVEIYQNILTDLNGKKNGEVRLGMAIKFIESSSEATSPLNKEEQRKYFVNYKGFPLAVDGTLILVGLFQILTFYYFSRKESLA